MNKEIAKVHTLSFQFAGLFSNYFIVCHIPKKRTEGDNWRDFYRLDAVTVVLGKTSSALTSTRKNHPFDLILSWSAI